MRTQDARKIPITEYLEKIGAKFARQQQGTHGLEYVYYSPARDDKKPSLCVNIEKNIWSDVPVGAGWRLIELVCHVHGILDNDVRWALSILDNLFPSASSRSVIAAPLKPRKIQKQPSFTHAIEQSTSLPIFEATGLNKKLAGLQVVKVTEIYHYPLTNYLTETRKIPLSIATHYLKEIHCKVQSTGKEFYALGFPAGKTYALRNKYFKGFASTGVDISVFVKPVKRALLFEGFMDFLSYLTAKQLIEPDGTAIVMNSSTMLHRVVEYLNSRPDIESLDYFRDRDELSGKSTGIESLKSLQLALPNIPTHDKSNTYTTFKDLNDWWIDFSAPLP